MIYTLLIGFGCVALLAAFFWSDYTRRQKKGVVIAKVEATPRLTQCPDCANEVSIAAEMCPRCGRPLKPKRPPEPQERRESVACGVFAGLFLFFIVLPILVWLTCISGIFMSGR